MSLVCTYILFFLGSSLLRLGGDNWLLSSLRASKRVGLFSMEYLSTYASLAFTNSSNCHDVVSLLYNNYEFRTICANMSPVPNEGAKFSY